MEFLENSHVKFQINTACGIVVFKTLTAVIKIVEKS